MGDVRHKKTSDTEQTTLRLKLALLFIGELAGRFWPCRNFLLR